MATFVMKFSLDMPYVDERNRQDLIIKALSESLELIRKGSEYGPVVGKEDDTIGLFEISDENFDAKTYNR